MKLPVAIVLGAGRGERFGCPKVLAPWETPEGAVPLGLAHVAARAEDCARVVLVVRSSQAALLPAHSLPAGASLLGSDEPDEHGPAGSLAAALAFLAPTDEDLVLVTPVDVPPASKALVRTLRDALEASPTASAVRPTFEGRGGHPVLVRAAVLRQAYREGRPPLREVLRAPDVGGLDVPVDEPDVRLDFDRADELAAYLEVRRRTTRT
jgi:molybdenum cofactor cytidylyltransferase